MLDRLDGTVDMKAFDDAESGQRSDQITPAVFLYDDL